MQTNLSYIKMEYNEIKQNIIENFLNPGFRFSAVQIPSIIIGTIRERSWFPVTYNEKDNTLTFNIGNNINIDVKCIWEEKPSGNQSRVYFHLLRFE